MIKLWDKIFTVNVLNTLIHLTGLILGCHLLVPIITWRGMGGIFCLLLAVTFGIVRYYQKLLNSGEYWQMEKRPYLKKIMEDKKENN